MSADGGRYALIVAAQRFSDPTFEALRAPATDAEALADVLRNPQIGGFEVQSLINEPCGTVSEQIEGFFTERKSSDLLLLYISCHGVRSRSGDLHFAMTNTRFDRLRATSVASNFIREQMHDSQSRRIVVLLDCCYSGAFLRGFRAKGGDDVAHEPLRGSGRAVITASTATEYAFEADTLTKDEGKPSIFTRAVVDGLRSGDADLNGDGDITVEELYDYVYEAVREAVHHQTPGRWLDAEGGLVVARNPWATAAYAALSIDLRQSIQSDNAHRRVGAVVELHRLLSNPSPEVAEQARTGLVALAADPDRRVSERASTALAKRKVTRPPVRPMPKPDAPPRPADPRPGIDKATEKIPVERPSGPTFEVPPASPPRTTPEPRKPRKSIASRASVWLAAIAVIAVATTVIRSSDGGNDPPPPTSSPFVTQTTPSGPTTSRRPPDYRPLSAPGVLPAGSYATSRFQPALRFTLGEGWEFLGEASDLFEFVRTENRDLRLSIARVQRVYRSEPLLSIKDALSAVERAPAILSDWLASLPTSSASGRSSVRIMNRPAQQVDVTFSGYSYEGCRPNRCVLLFQLDTTPQGRTEALLRGAGEKARFQVMDVDDAKIVMSLSAPAAQFEGFVAKAAQTFTPAEFVPTSRITSISLDPPPTPVRAGQDIPFTAQVSGPCGPTGTVSFYDGAVRAENRLNQAVIRDGRATLPIRFNGPGQARIVATYEGDANCEKSTAPPVIVQVDP
jgi:hypothetical protein